MFQGELELRFVPNLLESHHHLIGNDKLASQNGPWTSMDTSGRSLEDQILFTGWKVMLHYWHLCWISLIQLYYSFKTVKWKWPDYAKSILLKHSNMQ